MAGDVRPTDDIRYRGMTILPRAGVQVNENQVKLAILAAAVENPPDDLTWQTPDPAATVVDAGTKALSVFVLVGPSTNNVLAAGYWRVWAKITGNPEVAYEKSPDYFCIVG